MARDYQDYLEDCLEYGGQLLTREEFEALLIEELEGLKWIG